eukprot:gnl/TRDRNA2_/TRDRNA2_145060_c0_seq3.p1 gnl/TRDRNA2_/TRDRNA2_145060_c0~~gnl/TRDRNA2_/TRDRNA2_145060_c0_seq3.p1  ORF type:complete len:175 (+),score=22.07 gnl/TRDRNA2_/TRDRNA2_145060_c0_seq3:105-629(+)
MHDAKSPGEHDLFDFFNTTKRPSSVDLFNFTCHPNILLDATRVARDASTEKEYRVQLAGASGSVTSSQLAALSECLGVVSKDEGDSEPVTGFTAGGGVYGTSVELLEPEEDSEGQHRDLLRVVVCGQLPATHIRRTCGLAGLRPEAVVRTRIGRLSLGDLPVGQWTVVSSHDIL